VTTPRATHPEVTSEREVRQPTIAMERAHDIYYAVKGGREMPTGICLPTSGTVWARLVALPPPAPSTLILPQEAPTA